eukprot:6189793-Pleurochrysis_carterae.AAC.2
MRVGRFMRTTSTDKGRWVTTRLLGGAQFLELRDARRRSVAVARAEHTQRLLRNACALAWAHARTRRRTASRLRGRARSRTLAHARQRTCALASARARTCAHACTQSACQKMQCCERRSDGERCKRSNEEWEFQNIQRLVDTERTRERARPELGGCNSQRAGGGDEMYRERARPELCVCHSERSDSVLERLGHGFDRARQPAVRPLPLSHSLSLFLPLPLSLPLLRPPSLPLPPSLSFPLPLPPPLPLSLSIRAPRCAAVAEAKASQPGACPRLRGNEAKVEAGVRLLRASTALHEGRSADHTSNRKAHSICAHRRIGAQLLHGAPHLLKIDELRRRIRTKGGSVHAFERTFPPFSRALPHRPAKQLAGRMPKGMVAPRARRLNKRNICG